MSLLLAALMGVNAEHGLVGLSSPRQALPEPRSIALRPPMIGLRSRLILSTMPGSCRFALQRLDTRWSLLMGLWFLVGAQLPWLVLPPGIARLGTHGQPW